MKNVYISFNVDCYEPTLIYPELINHEKKDNSYKWATMYQCHAMLEQLRNVYVLRSPMDVVLNLGKNIGDAAEITNVEHFFRNAWHDAMTIGLNPKVYLFCEEPLEMSIEHPFMHDTELNKKGFIVPAKIDINNWYRRTQPSYQFFPNDDNSFLTIKKGDPIAYLRFHTSEKIKFIPYVFNKNLEDLEYERGGYMHLERKIVGRPEDRLNDSIKRIEKLNAEGKVRNTFRQRVLEEIKKSIQENSDHPVLEPYKEESRTCPYSHDINV